MGERSKTLIVDALYLDLEEEEEKEEEEKRDKKAY